MKIVRPRIARRVARGRALIDEEWADDERTVGGNAAPRAARNRETLSVGRGE